ncbi:hypothetical protein PQX77_002668 [Marasmius sp. AFHP31]|nr:hypothetical protein PQX77_002668 [Marasmius sp. AFHP31]
MPPKSSSSKASKSRPSGSSSRQQLPPVSRSSSPELWNNPPPSFHLRDLDRSLHRVHSALLTGQNVPEHVGRYWAPVFTDLYPDLVALRQALKKYPGVPTIIHQMLAAACIVAYAGGFDDEDWAIEHDEAIEIALINSNTFDVIREPLRASYLQPFVPHIVFPRLSTVAPLLDEDLPDAEPDAGPSQPSVRRPATHTRDPSSSPPIAPPAKRVRLLSPASDPADEEFFPSGPTRAPSDEPPTTRSKGKNKAAPKGKARDNKGKGKEKAKAPAVPVHRAYVLVPSLHTLPHSSPASQPKVPRVPRIVPSEAERSAGIQPFVKGLNLALSGPVGLEPLSFERLMNTQALSDPYLPGSWCSYCIARRLPDCVPEYHHKKGQQSTSPPIRCNNCRRADQRCSFSYGGPINEEWRTMQLAVGARQPQLIRHSFITLESLVQTHNTAVADAHRRMEQALQLRPIIEAQQRLFRLVGGDPKLLLGMLSHDRAAGPLTPDEAAMVAAVMGWNTVPSVAGFTVKVSGGHYFLFDKNRNLVTSSELADEPPEESSQVHAELQSSWHSHPLPSPTAAVTPMSIHDSSPGLGFPTPTPHSPVRDSLPPSSPTVSDYLLSRGPSLSIPLPATDEQMLVDLEAKEVAPGEESASEAAEEDFGMVLDVGSDADGDADIDPDAAISEPVNLVVPPVDLAADGASDPPPVASSSAVVTAPPVVPPTVDPLAGLSSNQRKKLRRRNRREREARERAEAQQGD